MSPFERTAASIFVNVTKVSLMNKPRLIVLLFGMLLSSMFGPGSRSEAADILRLDIVRTDSNVVLIWTNAGVALESSLVMTGNWFQVVGAVSPQGISPTNGANFYRLRVTNALSSF